MNTGTIVKHAIDECDAFYSEPLTIYARNCDEFARYSYFRERDDIGENYQVKVGHITCLIDLSEIVILGCDGEEKNWQEHAVIHLLRTLAKRKTPILKNFFSGSQGYFVRVYMKQVGAREVHIQLQYITA